MKPKYAIAIIAAMTLSAGCNRPAQQTASPLAPAAVTKLATGFTFVEGPAGDGRGALYFTDIPNNLIAVYTDADLTTYTDKSGGANGLYFTPDETLLVCQGGNRQVIAIDQNEDLTILADEYDGKKLNSPNDLWQAPNGGIYFTDPRYGDAGDLEQDGEHVYYITPSRNKVIKVVSDMIRPNGIIGTPDGRRLYIADHGQGITYSYKIKRNGTLTDKKFFAPQGSDGMTIDNAGNVYLTADGVNIYNVKGELIDSIDIPERPTNLTFAGPDNQTLFITAQTSLYSIRMSTTGTTTQHGEDK